MKWILLFSVGLGWSGETADAEIIRDLDFFSSIDLFQNYEVHAEDFHEVDGQSNTLSDPEIKKEQKK